MLLTNFDIINHNVTKIAVAIFLSFPLHNYGQSNVASAVPSFFDLLENEEYIETELSFDFSALNKNKNLDEYQPAQLAVKTPSGMIEWNVKVKPRGKHRKQICVILPIKLKIKKSDLSSLGVNETFNKYKIVTHCKEEFADEDLVLREFLTYKLYRTLTDESFRVILLKMKWNDTSGELQIGEQWAFLIEDNDELAQRMDGQLSTTAEYSEDILLRESNALNSLFQYAIGNLDWDQPTGKNIEVVKNRQTGKIAVVPYDFDFCAIVNPSYLSTARKYNLAHKRDRKYIGNASSDELNHAFQIFKQKEKQLYKTIDRFKVLSFNQRTDYKKYLNSFYKDAKEELFVN